MSRTPTHQPSTSGSGPSPSEPSPERTPVSGSRLANARGSFHPASAISSIRLFACLAVAACNPYRVSNASCLRLGLPSFLRIIMSATSLPACFRVNPAGSTPLFISIVCCFSLAISFGSDGWVGVMSNLLNGSTSRVENWARRRTLARCNFSRALAASRCLASSSWISAIRNASSGPSGQGRYQ